MKRLVQRGAALRAGDVRVNHNTGLRRQLNEALRQPVGVLVVLDQEQPFLLHLLKDRAKERLIVSRHRPQAYTRAAAA